jgi:alkylation response protein AidB-like acyl-CoA dehydrogenase
MNFGFTEEQELLRKTARDFLSEYAPSSCVREVMEGPEPYDAALWARLAELGWTGLALPEAHGGAGLSMIELCIVLEELGRSLAPVPFLPSVISGSLIAELGSDVQQAEWLPGLASGRCVASLAITEESGSDEPEAMTLRATRDAEGWRLDGGKLFVPDAAAADLILVVARTGGEGEKGLGVFAVPARSPGLSIEPLKGMDLLRPLHRLDFAGVRVEAGRLLGDVPDAWPEVRRVLDRARVMICAEMVGGADRCLEDSVQYAKERVQFGRPIGVHQAIKHKCADMLLRVESARSVTYYAAWAAAVDDEEAALASAMAKAYASDAYRHVSAENIQIHGGVGFTWEYDCHLYFKRAKSDEAWLGDGTRQRERVATLLEI